MVFMVTVMASCKKERSTFGGDFVGQENKRHVRQATTTGFQGWHTPDPDAAYMIFDTAPLGEVQDPIFGLTNSLVVSELYPTTFLTSGFSATAIESVELTFNFAKAYGKGELEVEVFMLSSRLPQARVKNEEVDWPADKTLATFTLNPADPSTMSVSIPLDKELGVQLVEGLDKIGDKLGNWPDQFHGIKLKAKRKDPSGEGLMVLLDVGAVDNGITVRWKDGNGFRSIQYGISSMSQRYFFARHDLSGSQLEGVLAKSPEEQRTSTSSLYITSDGGVDTFIDLTPLVEQWRDSLPMLVNRAELFLPVAKDMDPCTDLLVGQLLCLSHSSDGTLYEIPDYAASKSLYGGFFRCVDHGYTMDITMLVQSLLEDADASKTMCIKPLTYEPGVGRVVLTTGESGQAPLRVRLTYTRL